jgi:hypothetical protein
VAKQSYLWLAIGIACGSLLGCFPVSDHTLPELELLSVLPVEAPYPLEPSGLAAHNGRFYTVADKIDPIIFALEFEADCVRLKEAIVFFLPEKGPMDWEGITVDAGGTFYLISEAKGRVLRVTPDGTASWATDDLREAGRLKGLFAKDNAGFEGITWLGPNRWLGAVEREPRGILEWSGTPPQLSISATIQNTSPYQHALSFLRLADYAGLDTDAGRTYALFRNAHLVVELNKSETGWNEIAAWNYRSIETDPQYAYRNQTFGQAEGLVVQGQDIYLIFDNNRGPRRSDRNDTRPIFVHARRP